MMRAVLLAALLALPAAAQDFSAGSEAAEWGLQGERKARFAARVVDILCLLAGDCPPDCGAGTRQLGLLRSADGVLVLPLKNAQPLFSGAVADLAPFCGQMVEVDGLLVGDPALTPAPVYQVQRIRPAKGAWAPANRFTADWAARNPEAAALPGPWFRKDPRILAEIARGGYLGLGPEADRAFIAAERGR